MAVFWGKFYFFSFKYYLVASRKYWFKINKNLKWTEDQCPCQEKITAKLENHTGMWVNNQWRYLKHLENQQKQSLLFTHITRQSRFSVSRVHWADVSQRVERRQQNLLCVLIWRKTMMLLLPVLLLREVNNYCYLFTNKRTMSPKLKSATPSVFVLSVYIPLPSVLQQRHVCRRVRLAILLLNSSYWRSAMKCLCGWIIATSEPAEWQEVN